MSFYFPTDPGYRAAKRIKQGQDALDPRYDRFVSRFADTFGFPPLMVEADVLERAGGRTWPRLLVTLERTEQHLSFRAGGDPLGNPDSRKQRRVAELLVDAMAGASLRRLFGMPRTTPLSFPWRQEMFVGFGELESVAKREAVEAAPAEELEAWVASLGLGEDFWCVQRSPRLVVFVQTEEQAAQLRASERPAPWEDDFFALAQRYDDLGYLTRQDVHIEVDSRQNFEETYQGSWFAYFR